MFLTKHFLATNDLPKITSDDGGRPRVVQMQNLYDLTMDPPKEHAIPIQITTRRKDGRHVTSTTNTFEVAEAAGEALQRQG